MSGDTRHRPSIHDGWTPEPQEEIQPGDPWRDAPPSEADPGIWRDLLERTARMGSCSQTHHEFIARDVRAALDALDRTPR